MDLPNNCPAQLRAVIEKHAGRYHAIATELKVNVYHVYRYINVGGEPKRKDIREKMFLSTKRRANFRPPHWNWWRHLPPEQRDNIIRSAYERAKA